MVTKEKIDEILQSLSPIERKVLPCIRALKVEEIMKKSGLDETTVIRALQYLENKEIITKGEEKNKIIELDLNGILYLRQGLPERRLLLVVAENHEPLTIKEALIESKLTENEYKAALGALKKKALVSLNEGKLLFTGKKEEAVHKMLEERFLELLPLRMEELTPEQKYSYEQLKNRKEVVVIKNEKKITIKLTPLGEEVIKENLEELKDLLEEVTTEIIKKGTWKGKKFRKYDLKAPVPRIHGGKKHFVNQAIEYGRKIWTDMGFKEMTGTMTQIGFWNFDALFTAQDHPVREMQDTFYIQDVKGKLPDKKVVKAVKEAHEKGVDGSKGWGGEWNEEEAKKVVLRTHTTVLSARKLAELGMKKTTVEKTGKYFAIGMNFRNETVDWSHGFQFNQTEGIVIDKNATLQNLLGYLREFARKMGYEKVRFRPSYFPYTEPSLEGDVWNEEKKKWVEVFAAGIFRPEVVIPLLGEYIPVLAWGPGFDRILMKFYGITDLRDLYKNDINQLRKIKYWMK